MHLPRIVFARVTATSPSQLLRCGPTDQQHHGPPLPRGVPRPFELHLLLYRDRGNTWHALPIVSVIDKSLKPLEFRHCSLNGPMVSMQQRQERIAVQPEKLSILAAGMEERKEKREESDCRHAHGRMVRGGRRPPGAEAGRRAARGGGRHQRPVPCGPATVSPASTQIADLLTWPWRGPRWPGPRTGWRPRRRRSCPSARTPRSCRARPCRSPSRRRPERAG